MTADSAKVRVGNAFALVDAADLPLVTAYTWSLTAYGYAECWLKGHARKIFMHRLLVGPIPGGMVIDHADGNALNNTRANLRVCTTSQNSANSSGKGNKTGFKGVHYCRLTNLWRAEIYKDYRKIRLGRHSTPEQAAAAYDAAAREMFGEFARLNLKHD
jgi:hypothetical protein